MGTGFGNRQAIGGHDGGNDDIGFVAGNAAEAMAVNDNAFVVPMQHPVANKGFGQSQNLRSAHKRTAGNQK